jgi:hypothetical protein
MPRGDEPAITSPSRRLENEMPLDEICCAIDGRLRYFFPRILWPEREEKA